VASRHLSGGAESLQGEAIGRRPQHLVSPAVQLAGIPTKSRFLCGLAEDKPRYSELVGEINVKPRILAAAVSISTGGCLG
jgi:hypothetical protein